MKTKDFNKKLVLRKTTVTHLGDTELHKAVGGYTVYPECNTRRTVCRTECVTDCLQCPSVKCM